MKKLALFLLFLSCTSDSYDIPTITNNEQEVRYPCQSACYSANEPNCCNVVQCPGPRGPKGKRGKRGHQGPTGATGATGTVGNLIDEIFINAHMMSDDSGLNPNMSFFGVYGATTILDAWRMTVIGFDSDENNSIGAQFVIPSALDGTQPVILTIHCFNAYIDETLPGEVAFEVLADYKSSTEEVGIFPPATGFTETLVTENYLITYPTPGNLRYFTLSIPLDGALMAGNTWGNLTLRRLDVGYVLPIFLTALSIQYTKTNP